jgi:hypothetical protein
MKRKTKKIPTKPSTKASAEKRFLRERDLFQISFSEGSFLKSL